MILLFSLLITKTGENVPHLIIMAQFLNYSSKLSGVKMHQMGTTLYQVGKELFGSSQRMHDVLLKTFELTDSIFERLL